ncbi:hypothetical protein JN11_03592 [Mucilaginibacter frigoritolerans]|uniref:Pentapeptide MXKDX repeat protein n=1 Tax=Mucilaginibacter frigoritolerans TaxID=652788 RepID=A0A562TUB7_9SPHI|nr:hypothetical protein [Mucilaginibacter frigoritolerans]TWI97132.1 hypothetical protein JN11_03592 [Mucilaginibacter frigoritolerans]
MKSIFSAVIATAIVACLSLGVQAKTVNHLPATAVSDTGKMAKDKMSKDKMGKMSDSKMSKKKTSKMSDSKMSKKKMSKDTASKM